MRRNWTDNEGEFILEGKGEAKRRDSFHFGPEKESAVNFADSGLKLIRVSQKICFDWLNS